MFDFDAGKLLIIGVVALIVIGPKELPRVLRQVGQAVGRLRRMANEFQGQFMDAMKEADIQDIRDEMTKLGNEAQLNVHFDPARDIQSELTRAVDTPASVPVETPAAATDGFALPALAEIPATTETDTVAAAGLAPHVEAAPALSASVEKHDFSDPALQAPATVPDVADTAAALSEAKKRKIMLKKGRPVAGPAAVAAAGASRFRNVRPRRHEATEQ